MARSFFTKAKSSPCSRILVYLRKEKKYYLNTRGYDRSGRLNGLEVFCIAPGTGEDPLSDYFNGVMGFLGGGLGGEQ